MAGDCGGRTPTRTGMVVGPGARRQGICGGADAGIVPAAGTASDATYADAAKMLLGSLADQTEVPWPYDFSRKVVSTDSDVRDLQPQPSDDSAFQP